MVHFREATGITAMYVRDTSGLGTAPTDTRVLLLPSNRTLTFGKADRKEKQMARNFILSGYYRSVSQYAVKHKGDKNQENHQLRDLNLAAHSPHQLTKY